MKRVIGVTTLALAGVCLLHNTSGAKEQYNGVSRVSDTDVKFIQGASQDGLAEVRLGQLAARRGVSQAVRDFGRRMAQDHTAANDELIRLAARRGVLPPTTKGKRHIGETDHLYDLHGADFDRAYAHDMVRDHVRAIANFRKEADGGTDRRLTAFASRTLPTLEMHLRMARVLETKVNANGR